MAAFFMSGMTGLIMEVVWGRFMQLSIGATGVAHVVVLSTMMAGLALGNFIFGRAGDKAGNGLMLYGALELGIGLSTAIFPLLFDGLSSLYLGMASPDPMSSWNLFLRAALSAGLLLVPSTLMGGTLPVLTRLFAGSVDEVGRTVGRLYFINSFGAVLGCGLAGFVLLPSLGLDLSLMLPAIVNVLIGLACLGLARHRPSAALPRAPIRTRPAQSFSDLQIRWTLLLMLLSGVLTMVYELSWIRLLSLVMGSSVYSFSIMLMTFIAGIAGGGLIVARLLRRERDVLRLLGLAELGVFVSLTLLMPLYEVLPYYFNLFGSVILRNDMTFKYYMAIKILFCFVAMALPTIFIGMTLPLASRICVRKIERVGTGVGSVFSFNTLGNVLGALLVGHGLIRAVGLQWAILIGMVGSGLLGAAFLALRPQPGWRRYVPLAVMPAVSIAVLLLVPSWHPAALNSGRYRNRTAVAPSLAAYRSLVHDSETMYQVDGPDVSVAVLRSHSTGHLSMMVNGKPDAATGGDMSTQVMLGQLPVLVHDAPRDVLVVGLGSGVTAGAVLAAPVEHLDILEIAAEVADASRLFDSYSGAPLDDPRTRLHICDARDFLMLDREERYDIIISEPSNPWMAGIGNLMTVEFFQAALAVLKDDGLMVQWVHLYEMSPEVLSVILNTYSAVFPRVTVWCPRNADILLLGSRHPIRPSLAELNRRLAVPAVHGSTSGWGTGSPIRNGLEFLSMQVLSSGRFKELYPGEGMLNQDRFPFVEYAAPRAFFTGEDVSDFFLVDQRLRARPGNDLLLADALGEAALSDGDLRDLILFFSEGSTRWDDRHMKSLIHHLLMRSVDLQDGRIRGGGGDRDALDRILDPYLRRGDEARLGKLLLWRTKISGGEMKPADWTRYRLFEKRILLETLSVFSIPDTTRYDIAWRRCLEARTDSPDVLCAERRSMRAKLPLPPEPACL